jgi:superfamily II helicase
MWCVPTLDAEYIENMEDVLNVLARPYDQREPVVTFDERPVALHEHVAFVRDTENPRRDERS